MNYESSFADNPADMVVLDPDAAARRRRRRWIIGGVIAVLLILVIAVIAGQSAKKAAAPAAPAGAAAGAGDIPRISYIVPGRNSVAHVISATGSLAARREMPVGVVGEGGMVSRVLVEPGQWVGAGQALATIDSSVQTQQIRSLAAQVEVARADAKLAQSNLDRARQLVDRGFISKADIDEKTATRDAAVARVAVAQAQLAEQRASTNRLAIRAPAAGLVLARNVEPGQVVGGGSGVLFSIAKGGEMELRAQLPEGDLARVSVGDSATVTPVGSAESFAGRVWQVAPIVDPDNRQGIARIALSYDEALRPGGFAAAQIGAGSGEVPQLPESAVLSDDKGNYVYVIDAKDKVVRRDVKTGQVTADGIAIADGLEGNERVVATAGAFLNPGDKVKPVRATAAK